jgi:hypothetical protein
VRSACRCPELTAKQIVELRTALAGFAAEHGWVVD